MGKAQKAHRHGYSHIALCDCVHWATHERSFQHDVTSDLGLRDDFSSSEVNLARKHQEIVVGEAAMSTRIHELGYGQAILPFVSLQVLKSSGRIEVGLVGHCRKRRREGQRKGGGGGGS